jgi:hypothetical protein
VGISSEHNGRSRFYAFLGIVKFHAERFLALVDQVVDLGSVFGDPLSKIYQIKRVCLISLQCNTNYSLLPKNTRFFINEITKTFTQGMYFSYHYDLTNTFQRTATLSGRGKTLYEIADNIYTWNKKLCEDLAQAQIDTRWLVAIIKGYAKITNIEVKGKQLRLVLISRRSNKAVGMWPNAGVDVEGNAANSVESEQLLMYGNNVYSFVQVRGSVPVYWKKDSSGVQILRSKESFAAFSKHFDQLVNTYKRMIIFNLLGREEEKELIKAFEACESIYEKDNATVKYDHINAESKKVNSVNSHRGPMS